MSGRKHLIKHSSLWLLPAALHPAPQALRTDVKQGRLALPAPQKLRKMLGSESQMVRGRTTPELPNPALILIPRMVTLLYSKP